MKEQEQTRFEKIMDKIYSYRFWCYLREHQWTFSVDKGEIIYLNGSSPAQKEKTYCKRCGEKLLKENN